MAKSTFLSWDTTAANNTDVDGVFIGEGCPPSNVNDMGRSIMAVLRRDLDNGMVYAAKAGAYTAVAADNNAVLRFTAAATLSLTAAATLGADWHLTVIADGGDVTIDPNASETINGATTLRVINGSFAYLICTGGVFYAFVGSSTVFASATFKLLNAAGTPRAAKFDNTAMTADRTLTLQDRDMTVGMALLSKGSIPTTAAVDFAVPSGVRRLVLLLSSLSTNGTSVPIIQLKAGGAAETTGYSGSTFSFATSGNAVNISIGFSLATGNAAANVHHAKVEIILQDGNTWVGTVLNAVSNTGGNYFTSGSKTLAGVLDGIRLTTVGGTEVPDSGVYALYAEY